MKECFLRLIFLVLWYLFEIFYYFAMIVCHYRKFETEKGMCPRRDMGTRICNKQRKKREKKRLCIV